MGFHERRAGLDPAGRKADRQRRDRRRPLRAKRRAVGRPGPPRWSPHRMTAQAAARCGPSRAPASAFVESAVRAARPRGNRRTLGHGLGPFRQRQRRAGRGAARGSRPGDRRCVRTFRLGLGRTGVTRRHQGRRQGYARGRAWRCRATALVAAIGASRDNRRAGGAWVFSDEPASAIPAPVGHGDRTRSRTPRRWHGRDDRGAPTSPRIRRTNRS